MRPATGLGIGLTGLAVVALVVEASLLPAAWLPVQEAATIDQARGGSTLFTAPAGVLFGALLAPFASFGPDVLHAVGQALSVVCWSALAVPVYVLARRGATPLVAGVAAAAAVVAPASVYATAVVPEALATLLGALAVLVALHAAERRSLPASAVAVALALGAAVTRPWLAALPVALAFIGAADPVQLRRLLRWPTSLALVPVVVLGYATWFPVTDASPGLRAAFEGIEAVPRATLTSAAALALGVGVVPWLLVWAGRRTEPLVLVLVPVLAVSGGLAAVSRGAAVDERPLLVLLPLVFALAARRWATRDVVPGRLLWAAVGTTFCLLAVRGTVRAPVFDGATGFAAADAVASTRTAGVLFVLIAALLFRVGHRAIVPVTAVVLVGSQLVAYRDAHAMATRLAHSLPGKHAWIDDALPDGRIAFLASSGHMTSASQLAQTLIWNESLDGSIVVDSLPDIETGRLPGEPPSPYALAQGIELAGRPLATTRAVGTLVELAPPLRVAATVQGVDGDGWAGSHAVYRRFAGGPGSVRILVSRRAWGGADVPGLVSVFVGVPGAKAERRDRLTIHSLQEETREVSVPSSPFEVSIVIEPTFSPARFGQSDTRELGAQLGFTFVPR